MGVAPSGERVDDQFANVVGDLLVVSGGFDHFAPDAFICLKIKQNDQSRIIGSSQDNTHLPRTGTIVPHETSVHPINRRRNISESVAVHLLCIGPHARNGEDLLVLNHALLELLEENTQAARIVGGPERVYEAGHFGARRWRSALRHHDGGDDSSPVWERDGRGLETLSLQLEFRQGFEAQSEMKMENAPPLGATPLSIAGAGAEQKVGVVRVRSIVSVTEDSHDYTLNN